MKIVLLLIAFITISTSLVANDKNLKNSSWNWNWNYSIYKEGQAIKKDVEKIVVKRPVVVRVKIVPKFVKAKIVPDIVKTKSKAEKAIYIAVVENKKAGKLGFEWRDTSKIIKRAEKLKDTEPDTAIKLANKAILQALNAQTQALVAKSAGPRF